MTIARRDDWLTDAQGRALAGATVYYCTQPANTTTTPPSPLATVYSDTEGDPGANPQITDGFGHAVAYLQDSILFTIVYDHPLFGPNPVVLPDQSVGGGGGGGGYLPFFGVPVGTVDGSNTNFVLTNQGIPLTTQPVFVIFWVNFPLVEGLGFNLSGPNVTTAAAPQVNDTVYATGLY